MSSCWLCITSPSTSGPSTSFSTSWPALRRRARCRPASAAGGKLRRLRRPADPDTRRCRGRGALGLLARAVGRQPAGPAIAHRPAATGRPDLPGRRAPLHPRRNDDGRAQAVGPERGRDALHDAAGGLRRIAAPLQRPGRPDHRLTFRVPRPGRAGGSGRLPHQSAGPARRPARRSDVHGPARPHQGHRARRPRTPGLSVPAARRAASRRCATRAARRCSRSRSPGNKRAASPTSPARHTGACRWRPSTSRRAARRSI